MSQYATELCCLLVDDTYGELTSRVFGVLICYGRLTHQSLLQYSKLSPRQLKHSLAVLVQQHLALWYTPTDGGVTYYEADWTSAYDLVRHGKLLRLVEDRCGHFAAGIVSNLLLSGHAQVSDLAQAYDLKSPEDDEDLDNGSSNSIRPVTNGHTKHKAKGQSQTLESFHSTLNSLLNTGILSQTHISYFRSEADNRIEAENVTLLQARFQGNLNREKKIEYESAVSKQVIAWKFGLRNSTSDLDTRTASEQPHGRKRKFVEPEDGQYFLKRKWLANGSNGEVPGNQAGFVASNLVLRINNNKTAVIARHERLVELTEEQLGKPTSEVYAMILRHFEKELQCCRPNLKPGPYIDSEDDDDTERNFKVSTMTLAMNLEQFGDIDKVVGEVDDPSKIDLSLAKRPRKRRRIYLPDDEAEVEGDASPDEDEDENEDDYHQDMDMHGNDKALDLDEEEGGTNGDTTSYNALDPPNQSALKPLRQILLLLAEHPYHFLTYLPPQQSRPESWTINYPSLTHTLRFNTLESIIQSRYSTNGLRLTRILAEKGKLDEKSLAGFALMNQKTMRSILTTMHEAGHLEVQEVPREPNRQPSKTIFLWWWDQERCTGKMVEECYKAMARCVQRTRVEREAVRELVEKAGRMDVVGREEELLSVGERRGLRVWREREARLWGEVSRLDDLIAVLRDF